ncbi:MAG: hypothetical protein WBM22_11900, partial [Pseudomonas fluorescens]
MDMAHAATPSMALKAPLERHQLVWLKTGAWQEILSRPWDDQAAEILTHWHAQQLPLMVTRQRVDAAPDLVCLGLPAPARWGKRKLALRVDLQSYGATAPCPTLADVAEHSSWREAAFDLCAVLAAQGVQPRVYGSYAWQHLS